MNHGSGNIGEQFDVFLNGRGEYILTVFELVLFFDAPGRIEEYKKETQTNDFIKFLLGKGMTNKDIHTSGHADLGALKRMIDVLKPKNLVPVTSVVLDSAKASLRVPPTREWQLSGI